MTPSASKSPEPIQASTSHNRLFAVLTAGALLLGAARRLLTGWDPPLWLDEIYTGAIAIQPTFRGLIEDCLNELSGPVFYTTLWLWEKLAGSSDTALRIPSLVFALAAPVLILLYGHPDRRVRQIWAAVAALWLPGLYYATEARPYSLLFLLGTGQAILFCLLLRTNAFRHAAAWCVVSALLILTHYHALAVSAFQGLAYLAVHRKNVLRNWPAALVFVPVAAWMVIHLPLLFSFAAPDVAWQQVLPPSKVKALPDLLFGGGRWAGLLLLAIAGTSAVDLYRSVWLKKPLPYRVEEILAVTASILAILLVFGIGFIRPSFSARYLIPYVPGLLFGVSLWARHWGRKWPVLPPLLIIALAIFCARDFRARSADPTLDFRRYFTWEEASEFLEYNGAKRVIFFWDNPTAALGNPDLFSRVGGFFYNRSGTQVRVRPLLPPKRGGDIDPNAILLARTSRLGEGFIWLSDVTVSGTQAIRHPPNLELLGNGRKCRNFGRKPVTVLACVRVPATPK
jgi:hypothetical protein